MCLCCRDGGKRKHQGVDIVCADGATVYAPFNVKLNGKAAPYKKNNAINDGINLSGEGLYLHLLNVLKALIAMQQNSILLTFMFACLIKYY